MADMSMMNESTKVKHRSTAVFLSQLITLNGVGTSVSALHLNSVELYSSSPKLTVHYTLTVDYGKGEINTCLYL